MALTWIEAKQFRNLEHVRLELSPGFNLIFGDNGSGKTSLLEACHFLASARSFRTSNLDPIIQKDSDSCLVRGQVVGSHLARHELGVSRNKQNGDRQIRIDGEKIKRSSDLARLLPTLVLGPDSVELLLGAPAERRKFLNWGLFHVEHGFAGAWEVANRCLRQRNQVLRDRPGDLNLLRTWDQSFVEVSETIDRYRQSFLTQYQPVFKDAVGKLLGISDVEFQYARGWAKDQNLIAMLENDRERDQKRGFTQKGFHRADVRISIEGQPATKICSRGELKSLVWAMVLAQGRVVDTHLEDHAVYLIDDLASEFDAEHRKRVCQYLADNQSQVLLTGIEQDDLLAACEGDYGRMFHVEHGQTKVLEN